MIANLLSHSNICKECYRHLVQKKASTPLRSEEKWLSEGDIVQDSIVNWKNSCYLPFLCTRETKLRVFLFKFLHRRIATNDFLCKIDIKQVDSCSFCGETSETLFHLFWYCKHTARAFWKSSFEWISQHLEDLKDISLSPTLCLDLINDVSHLLLHHLLLIARHYIYNCKLRNTIPKVQLYKQLLVNSMKIEKQIALDSNTLNSFKKNWSPLKNAFQSQMIN